MLTTLVKSRLIGLACASACNVKRHSFGIQDVLKPNTFYDTLIKNVLQLRVILLIDRSENCDKQNKLNVGSVKN